MHPGLPTRSSAGCGLQVVGGGECCSAPSSLNAVDNLDVARLCPSPGPPSLARQATSMATSVMSLRPLCSLQVHSSTEQIFSPHSWYRASESTKVDRSIGPLHKSGQSSGEPVCAVPQANIHLQLRSLVCITLSGHRDNTALPIWYTFLACCPTCRLLTDNCFKPASLLHRLGCFCLDRRMRVLESISFGLPEAWV